MLAMNLTTHLSESANLNIMMTLADSKFLDDDHKVLTVVLEDSIKDDPVYIKEGKFYFSQPKLMKDFILIMRNGFISFI